MDSFIVISRRGAQLAVDAAYKVESSPWLVLGIALVVALMVAAYFSGGRHGHSR